MRAANPYNYNLPVEPEMFFGRQGEVEALTRYLTTMPGDSFALIGGRRMGKTSLLEALLRALRLRAEGPARGVLPLPVFLDLTDGRVDSTAAFVRTVAEEARPVLAGLLDVPLADVFPLEPGQLPAPAFHHALMKWGRAAAARRGRRLRLVLLLDECEQIVEQPWAADFYGALRSLLVGQATRSLLKVVMSGSHRFLTQVRQRGSPLRNVLKYHRLCVLGEQATRDLIVQPTCDVLPGAVVQAVVGQSGGHPFLTQYLMHHLWERGLDGATPEAVREIATGFAHERSDFQDWTEGLGNRVMWIYGVLAQVQGALAEARIRAVLGPNWPDLPQALDALCYHGLVVSSFDGENYQTAGEMFRRWFTDNVAGRFQRGPLEQPEMPQMPTATQVVVPAGSGVEGEPAGADRREQEVHRLLLSEEMSGLVPVHPVQADGRLEWFDDLSDLQPTKSRKEVGPMRILFLAANPVDTDPLRLSEEVRTIDERLRAAQFRDRFELIQHWAVRHTDLSEYLLRHTPHIVHFSGHGSQRGEIILENATGIAQPVSAEALGRLFRVLKDNIRCVVLNACMSAVQAQAIVQEIDCVVGMSRAIGDEAAILFAGGFYRALGYGRSIQTAFDLGCSEIDLSGLGEEAIPKLLVKGGVDAASLVLEPGTQRSAAPVITTDLASSSEASQFHRVLRSHLGLDELRTLCLDLGVSYDDLGGVGLSGRARELILYLQRRGDLPRLVEWLRRERPDIGID